MKLISRLILIVLIATTGLSSCVNEVTYADQLKSEKKLIASFLSRNKIKVVTKMPTTFPWPDNVYYKSSSGLYFRLEEQGDKYNVDGTKSKDSVTTNDLVINRYIKYTLNTVSDTSYYQNTVDYPFPISFYYNDASQTSACDGWHEAVKYMQYNNSAAKIIVYSKLGFSNDESSVIPYGYDMRIKIRK